MRTGPLTIADIAELHKNIAIASYALAHIEARFESSDVEIADQALKKAAHIINKILGVVSGQEKVEEEKDNEP